MEIRGNARARQKIVGVHLGRGRLVNYYKTSELVVIATATYPRGWRSFVRSYYIDHAAWYRFADFAELRAADLPGS